MANDKIVEIDQLTLDAELAMRRARRLIEWMRAVYANEAQYLHAAESPQPSAPEPDPETHTLTR